MKKGKWMIFKCQNCGKKFEEKPPKDKEYKAEHVGKYTHIISTHKCGDRVYGCAKLIGMHDWDDRK